MISSEAKRTLVKSPPELWSELSEPVSLARHLGDLEGIAITKLEPESTLEWQAGSLSGSVKIEPAGWGTTVTLRLERPIEPAEDAHEGEGEGEGEPGLDGESKPEGESKLEGEPDRKEERELEPQPPGAPLSDGELAEPSPAVQDEARPGEEAPPWRPRLFARLLRRFSFRAQETASDTGTDPLDPGDVEPIQSVEADAPQAHEASVPAPGASVAAPARTSTQSPQDGPSRAADLSGELEAAEEAVVAQDTALLIAVLDRLGAAHHRPFSRA